MPVFVWLFFLILFLIGTAVYFLPTIVGTVRRVPDRGVLVLVNLLLGWSLIGWVVALVMALRSPATGDVVLPPPPPRPEPSPLYDVEGLEAAEQELPDDPFKDLA